VGAFFFLKDSLCIAPLLASGIAGSLNFLPLPLSASQICCILLILYYITGYVIIRQKPIKLGNTKFFWPILIVTLLVLYNNHNLGLRVMGGDTEGAKPAFLIYLVVFAYFCGINIPTPSVALLSKVPLYYVILVSLSSIPYLLSTYIPGLSPYLFSVTNNVNIEAYMITQLGAGSESEGVLGRLSALGPIGGALQLYLLCYYPIGTWLRPERWWVFGLSLICVALAIASGYRNTIFGFAMITLVAIWAYYSWRSLFLPVGVFIVMSICLIASNNNLIHVPLKQLPMIAQRSLSFLPGDWDKEAIESGESSNKFRKNIQDVYIKEYMLKSPLTGNGFAINLKEFNSYGDALTKGTFGSGAGVNAEYLQAKAFIVGKLYHTGWISVYDCVGIIGSIAFIALGWNEIAAIGYFIFGAKADRRSPLFPLYVWLLANIASMMICYFTVFGDFKDTFMNLCVYAIILTHLLDIKKTVDVPTILPDDKGQIEFGRLGGAHYGYQSRP